MLPHTSTSAVPELQESMASNWESAAGGLTGAKVMQRGVGKERGQGYSLEEHVEGMDSCPRCRRSSWSMNKIQGKGYPESQLSERIPVNANVPGCTAIGSQSQWNMEVKERSSLKKSSIS